MQRNRSQAQGNSPGPTSSAVVTRSRSASSSRTSNTGSSSSGSSSSASSSSSSSSGSDSDSSSSDTEASRASSRQSRTSRASRSSQKSTSVTPKKTTATAGKSAGGSKKPPNTQAPTSTSSNNAPASKARISGSVTNTSTVPKSKPAVKNARRKSIIASSSESESVVDSTPVIKKVGSKPPSTSISVKKPPTQAAVKAAIKRKQQQQQKQQAAKSNANKNSGKKSNANASSSSKQALTGSPSVQRKLMKSIFSPENSSEDTDTDSKPKIEKVKSKPNVVCNGSSSTKFVKNGGTGNKKKGANQSEDKKKKAAVAPSKPATSSSASASSSASSSCSSSDSSSDSEKKNEELVNNDSESKKDSSPSSASRKRPVTRRQRGAVKSKTIPTTTTFNQSALTKPQSQVATLWDSDFSDEPKSLARAPTKSNQKSRKLTEEDEEALEREKKCPFPCCNSQGHLSGKYSTHSMLTTCPKYHGFTPEECKENADERTKREIERKKYYVPNQPHHKKAIKLSQEAKNWVSKTKELKAHDTVDGLCSQYDLSLWNDALAVAAQRIETEQGEGLGHRSVAMGRWEMSCWCASPYPEPLCQCRRLFICEFCLKPVQSGTVLRRHCAKCVWRHPPGDEIYRKERLSVWEVDGKSQKTYCQNLCLLAKCFLDHKTLYLDVDPFLFYVMTLADNTGCHIVGYFSKEKNSFLNYNVSCILTLPPYQRQGFGRLLIEFSYLLTRVEGKVGSPEKPLSDLGLISYRSYWKDAVLRRLCACASREMNVKDLSMELGVTSADLISTLQFLGMLKYWKGKHLVLKKQDVLEEYLERVRRRGEQRSIDSSCLRWRPYQPPPESQS
ncbi:unnamed protein product [Allacma fusca]|uniref:Histone acetyltransferase n=1 Tax=Allacma fusca TaxID=39272 RepID=A0A8J2KMW2_9HEXA|nr:unnamed protein product [Allacma fusca]